MTFNEQLRELNLTEEQLKTINTALKAEYVPKTEYERLFDNLNAAKSEHKKKTEFLKQSAADKLERQKRLYELKLKDNLVDIAIEEAGAKSREIVRALIDTEKVEIKEDKLTGLTPQLTELKKNAPFLFEKKLMYLTVYSPEASSDLIPKINTADMTYSQAVAFLDN